MNAQSPGFSLAAQVPLHLLASLP